MFNIFSVQKNRKFTPYLAILISACLWISPMAQAQTVIVANNTTITAIISESDVTRIAVAGDRITLVRGTAAAYTVSNDTAQGAIFIKPVLKKQRSIYHHSLKKSQNLKITKKPSQRFCPVKSQSITPFYLFISTEKAHNYVLLLTPKKDYPPEILVLKPLELEKIAAQHWEKSGIYSQTLAHLVTSIVNQTPPPGYILKSLHQDFQWGDQVILQLRKQYSGAQWRADVYQVTNQAHHPVTLTEKDLYQAGDQAIYLGKRTLAQQESTVLIKIRSNHD